MTQVSAVVRPVRREGAGSGSVEPTLPPTATPFFQRDGVRLASVFVQFGLLVYVIRVFAFEGVQLADVALLAWVGFLIHHYLPMRWRLPFFAALSLASIPLAVGLKVGAMVIGVGMALIALCHRKWPFRIRIGLLISVGGGLLVFRLFPFSPPIVILASFFMFRLIIYMYELRQGSAPFSPVRAVAYFFMLPNVCFPLFPVVDYKTFCTTYYNDAPLSIYQRGLRWMLRGLVHLLLYRLVYQFMLIEVFQVADLGDVVRFMLATFLLYLRVSGQFHLIVGMLHLFGFNLPETHHLYWLSSSFMDFWRRINIYWKDFIVKLFFTPAYFRLKKLGPRRALALATIYALACTWLLHAYQWTWLRGTLEFTWQDTIFWWTLAALVLVNALWEARRGRQRLHKGQRTLGSELGLALRTIGTFVTICSLWTFWSVQSGDELVMLLSAARHVSLPSVLAIAAGLLGIGVAAVLFGHSTAERTEVSLGTKRPTGSFSFWPSAGIVTAGACAFVAFALVPTKVAAVRDSYAGEMMTSLSQERLNEMDMRVRTRGYYEELDVSRNEVRQRLATHPNQRWPVRELYQETSDFMLVAPKPSKVIEFEGRRCTFNHRAMRGPAYDSAKAPGVFRIAILGSSTEAGHGVDDELHMARLLEKRLSQQDIGEHIRKFEVWNFSVEAYGAPQKLLELERRVLQYQPDLVLYFTYRREAERTSDQLSRIVIENIEIPELVRDSVTRLFAKAEVDSLPLLRSRIERQLMRHMPGFLNETFELFAQQCAKHHVRGCFVYRPEPKEFRYLHATARNEVLTMARNTGLPTLDLADSYRDVADRDSLMVVPESTFAVRSINREGADDHPNAEGHRLVAEELYRLLHSPEYRDLLNPRESQ